MNKISINWILDIEDYEIDLGVENQIKQFIADYKEYLTYSHFNIVIISNKLENGFQKTLKKYKDFLKDSINLDGLNYDEGGFALFVPTDLLKDQTKYLIIAKSHQFLDVSVIHEIFHKIFEKYQFKKEFMPGLYINQGEDFSYYLEEFFVEFLTVELFSTTIFQTQTKLENYLKLNRIEIEDLINKTLNIYKGFKLHGGNDLKGLFISLLSCYYILFATWKSGRNINSEYETPFKQIWNEIVNLEQLSFFKPVLIELKKILIDDNVKIITENVLNLFKRI